MVQVLYVHQYQWRVLYRTCTRTVHTINATGSGSIQTVHRNLLVGMILPRKKKQAGIADTFCASLRKMTTALHMQVRPCSHVPSSKHSQCWISTERLSFISMAYKYYKYLYWHCPPIIWIGGLTDKHGSTCKGFHEKRKRSW